MSPLLQLTYASAATRSFDQAALLQLLAGSRANNARVGITGLLLHRGGNFLQLVEGPEEAVRGLARRIEADGRHHHFTPLLQPEAATRVFPDWTMGFEEVDQMPPAAWPGLSRFLQDVAPADPPAKGKPAALFFFEAFRSSMR